MRTPAQWVAGAETFRRGAGFLKMCVTGGVVHRHEQLTDTQFSHGEIAAAAEEARTRGTYATVHAHNNAGIRNAVTALVSATRVNADILGIGAHTGTIEAGKRADIVGFAGNPLDEPGLFADRDTIRLVIKNGLVVKDR